MARFLRLGWLFAGAVWLVGCPIGPGDDDDDAWVETGEMNQPRWLHTATTLEDGRVLVAGGWYEVPLASVEIFDPGTGTWTEIEPLHTGRTFHTTTLLADGSVLDGHTATVLEDGRVLVTGNSGAIAATELFDPVTEAWSEGPPMNQGRAWHAAAPLDDGRVLVCGGEGLNIGNAPIASAEIFTP